MEKLELLHTADAAPVDRAIRVPQNIKNNYHIIQEFHFWNYIQRTLIQTSKQDSNIAADHVHGSIPNNQKVGVAQAFTDG